MFDASDIHHLVFVIRRYTLRSFVLNSPRVGAGIADCVAPFRTGVAHRLAGADAAGETFREAGCFPAVNASFTLAQSPRGPFLVPPLLCPIWASNAPGGHQSPLVTEGGSTPVLYPWKLRLGGTGSIGIS